MSIRMPSRTSLCRSISMILIGLDEAGGVLIVYSFPGESAISKGLPLHSGQSKPPPKYELLVLNNLSLAHFGHASQVSYFRAKDADTNLAGRPHVCDSKHTGKNICCYTSEVIRFL